MQEHRRLEGSIADMGHSRPRKVSFYGAFHKPRSSFLLNIDSCRARRVVKAPLYYRGAHAAILVFDSSKADTLGAVDQWIDGRSHGHTCAETISISPTTLWNRCVLN